MATNKEIKEFLQEYSLSRLEMDKVWGHSIMYPYDKSELGIDWRQLNSGVFPKILNYYEKEQRRIRIFKAQQEAIEEEFNLCLKEDEREYKEECRKTQYRIEHFDEIILKEIDQRIELSQKDLSHLIKRREIEREYFIHEKGWLKSATSILKINDRTFKVDWKIDSHGDNTPLNITQPVEVKPVYLRMEAKKEWVEK